MNNDLYNVIISIKPVYADMILNGRKRYEFRKCSFKKHVDKVFIYLTKPVNKIIGYFTFDEVLRGTPSEIWQLCSEYAGITEEDFYKYFRMSKNAFAIKINKVFRMNKAVDPFDAIEGFKSPRSFIYINQIDFSRLIGH